MLPGEVDWKILSHCDGQVVADRVEYDGRPAMTVLPLKSMRLFKKC